MQTMNKNNPLKAKHESLYILVPKHIKVKISAGAGNEVQHEMTHQTDLSHELGAKSSLVVIS